VRSIPHTPDAEGGAILIRMTKFAYTIVFVSDMGRSVAFYRDTVGLPLKMESPEWSEFATEGCTLALHKSGGGVAAPVQDGKIPAAHCHTGFVVEDIDALAERMRAAGAEVMQAIRLEDFGARMGVWRDPDGLPVSAMAWVPKG
jgi:lactoylglutathione lyase